MTREFVASNAQGLSRPADRQNKTPGPGLAAPVPGVLQGHGDVRDEFFDDLQLPAPALAQQLLDLPAQLVVLLGPALQLHYVRQRDIVGFADLEQLHQADGLLAPLDQAPILAVLSQRLAKLFPG